MSTEQAPQAATDPSNDRSAKEVVEAFLSALERLDLDGVVSLAAPNIRWINAPLKSASDREGFRKALLGMFKEASRFEVQYLDIHERGNGVVYTDRIDIFEGGGVQMQLPIQGEFRVENGLVSEWIDRFSWLELLGEIGKSLPAILKHRLGR